MTMLQIIIPPIPTPQKIMLEALQSYNPNKVIANFQTNFWAKILKNPMQDILETITSIPTTTPTGAKTLVQKPQLVHARYTPITNRHKSRMGLRQIEGGNFTFHRKALRKVSLNNREGQLLELFIKNQNFFVNDTLIDEKFNTKDVIERSKIVTLLKKKFKGNRIKATIDRQGDGYILIHLEYLQ